MSTEHGEPAAAGESGGLGLEEGIRTLLLLMPRMVGRIKRAPVPESCARSTWRRATCPCSPCCCSTAR
ncbi:hypothetical protein [Thermocatellispora tengchongensis]|uniref:hypothetical protein n=1 Tax=Thermocatellispora tengchongensis TaxID=1073253 RepID=UPI003628C2A1